MINAYLAGRKQAGYPEIPSDMAWAYHRAALERLHDQIHGSLGLMQRLNRYVRQQLSLSREALGRMGERKDWADSWNAYSSLAAIDDAKEIVARAGDLFLQEIKEDSQSVASVAKAGLTLATVIKVAPIVLMALSLLHRSK